MSNRDRKEQVASGNIAATHNVQSMWPCDTMLQLNSKTVICHTGPKKNVNAHMKVTWMTTFLLLRCDND